MNKRYLGAVASLLLTILIMIVIFMLSAQDSSESSSLSDLIARMLAGVLIFDFHDLSADEQMRIIEQWSWPIRKTAHASEYACLAISLVVTCWQIAAWRHETREGARLCPRRIPFVGMTAFAIAVLYACSDEIHQLFIDGRAGQVADVLVDASGAAIGCLLMCLLMWRFMARRMRRC